MYPGSPQLGFRVCGFCRQASYVGRPKGKKALRCIAHGRGRWAYVVRRTLYPLHDCRLVIDGICTFRGLQQLKCEGVPGNRTSALAPACRFVFVKPKPSTGSKFCIHLFGVMWKGMFRLVFGSLTLQQQSQALGHTTGPLSTWVAFLGKRAQALTFSVGGQLCEPQPLPRNQSHHQ